MFPTPLLIRSPFSRKNSSYTIAKFKDDQPNHTIAVFKPYENEIDYELPKPVYRPLLGPGQFILVDQDDDTHEGEVIAGDDEAAENSNQLYQFENNEYHTIDENNILTSFGDSNQNIIDSYFPDENQDFSSTNLTGYPESYYSHSVKVTDSPLSQWFVVPADGGDSVLDDQSSNNSVIVKVKNENSQGDIHYYIGYKIWYSAVVFAIYHTTITLIYYLTLLAKHYLQFPAALKAAAAESSSSLRFKKTKQFGIYRLVT